MIKLYQVEILPKLLEDIQASYIDTSTILANAVQGSSEFIASKVIKYLMMFETIFSSSHISQVEKAASVIFSCKLDPPISFGYRFGEFSSFKCHTSLMTGTNITWLSFSEKKNILFHDNNVSLRYYFTWKVHQLLPWLVIQFTSSTRWFIHSHVHQHWRWIFNELFFLLLSSSLDHYINIFCVWNSIRE